MNNNLDVKSAYDNIHEKTSEIYRIRQSLSAKDIKNMLNGLRQIDGVLQCLF